MHYCAMPCCLRGKLAWAFWFIITKNGCLIKAMRKVLVMHRLRFSDEIRSEMGIVIPEVEVKKEELKMASMLIGQLTKNSIQKNSAIHTLKS